MTWPRKKKYKGIITTKSHIDGSEINRWCNLHRSVKDLLTKQKSTRSGIHNCGFCMQRCMGNDGLNALYVVTKELDEKYGTGYHSNFQDYVTYFQKNDLTSALAQTDVKGDRSKRPGAQDDPDHYVRVVKKTKDGGRERPGGRTTRRAPPAGRRGPGGRWARGRGRALLGVEQRRVWEWGGGSARSLARTRSLSLSSATCVWCPSRASRALCAWARRTAPLRPYTCVSLHTLPPT